MSIVTTGDFSDLFHEVKRRGLQHIIHKLSLSNSKRIIYEWECIDHESSDWWTIPSIRSRWNKIISGSVDIDYQEYFCSEYLRGKNNLRMLSVGCGGGTAEIKFSLQHCFEMVEGFDISPNIVAHANEKIKRNDYQSLRFFTADAYTHDFGIGKYDIILFNGSLHHFSTAEELLLKSSEALKPDGFLLLVEYVGPNRFQWKENQLRVVNDLLKKIPEAFRTRQDGKSVKQKVFRPGTLRMFLNDPSESLHSEDIPEMVNKYFSTVEEKKLGGNILHLLLKDIAHNFRNGSQDADVILQNLFSEEDEFLKTNSSDFLFGVYKKIQP